MHIAGHFHGCEDEVAATSTDCQTIDHKVHLTADGVHSDAHSKPSGIATDCSIYHVYVGLNGCLTAALSMSILPTRGVVDSFAKIDDIKAEAVDRLRIRGPPLLS